MGYLFEEGEESFALQRVSWLDDRGLGTPRSLGVTSHRIRFYPLNWQKRARRNPDFYFEFDRPRSALADITVYPIWRRRSGSAHLFVRFDPGPPTQPDSWNSGWPKPKDVDLVWRLWADRYDGPWFERGLGMAGLVKVDRFRWIPR